VRWVWGVNGGGIGWGILERGGWDWARGVVILG